MRAQPFFEVRLEVANGPPNFDEWRRVRVSIDPGLAEPGFGHSDVIGSMWIG